MSSQIYPGAHRVLEIPELLHIVFSSVDRRHNISNALVCKRWSNVALDHVWRVTRSLSRLVSILAPLNRNFEPYRFNHIPTAQDWERFDAYACRVRELYHTGINDQILDPMDQEYDVLDESVYDIMARTRTRLTIFPNLHTLVWTTSFKQSVLFMHANIKSFTIRLPPHGDIGNILQDITARMPNLTKLSIARQAGARDIEDGLVGLFDGLPKLRSLTVPRYYITSRIAESLSRSPSLTAIDFQYQGNQGCGDPLDVMRFSPTLVEGAFPSLWELSFTASFTDTKAFLTSSFAPANLTLLFVHSPFFQSPTDIYNLLKEVAANCQLVRSVTLLTALDTTRFEDAPIPDECVTLDTLRPLFDCSNLVSFELGHQNPIMFNQEDIEEFARKWPSLQSLKLNNEPAVMAPTSLTLEALLPFSRYCPQLEHLGLYLSADKADVARISSNFVPFKKLLRLSVGISIICDTGDVALFLSEICPLECDLECGVTWDESAEIDSAAADEARERCEEWERVTELVPLLTRLRTQERARTKRLEEEVEDLRMANAVLKDRLKIQLSDTCVAS